MRAQSTRVLRNALSLLWTPREPLELRSVAPELNRFRRYRVTERLTLAGEMELVIDWGRVGGAPKVKVERFADPADLDRRREELLTKRLRHGYQRWGWPGSRAG